MDKKIIRENESILFSQILVLNALNKVSSNFLTKENIFSLLKQNDKEEKFVNTVLGTMIAKGMITPSFAKGTIAYSITDFGLYFFEKFKDINDEYFRQQIFEVKV